MPTRDSQSKGWEGIWALVGSEWPDAGGGGTWGPGVGVGGTWAGSGRLGREALRTAAEGPGSPDEGGLSDFGVGSWRLSRIHSGTASGAPFLTAARETCCPGAASGARPWIWSCSMVWRRSASSSLSSSCPAFRAANSRYRKRNSRATSNKTNTATSIWDSSRNSMIYLLKSVNFPNRVVGIQIRIFNSKRHVSTVRTHRCRPPPPTQEPAPGSGGHQKPGGQKPRTWAFATLLTGGLEGGARRKSSRKGKPPNHCGFRGCSGARRRS